MTHKPTIADAKNSLRAVNDFIDVTNEREAERQVFEYLMHLTRKLADKRGFVIQEKSRSERKEEKHSSIRELGYNKT